MESRLVKKLESLGDLDREAVALIPAQGRMVLFQECTQVAVAAVLHNNALDLRRRVRRHSVEGDNKVIVMDSCQDLQLICKVQKNSKKGVTSQHSTFRAKFQ